MYANIKYLQFLKFKGCDNCIDCCKKPMAPLILEDFEKVYNYFPILIAKLEVFKPVMLLSNEISCPYLINEKCSIYENRPPACKIYPFSPWYDEILIDLSCKGVGIEGKLLPLTKEEFIKSDYYDSRVQNITKKLEDTFKWLENKKLELFKEYNGIELYTLAEFKDSYDQLIKKSLKHLSKYFIS